MTKKLYKFLRTDLKSQHGNCTWKIGEWKHEDEISLCDSGFHASKTPLQALGYVAGEILAVVEVKGKHQKEDDKEVWSDMRIIKAYKWQQKDSIALAIFSAESCLKNFEKMYPDDKRPREAIEAARKVLLDPTAENKKSAARSAAAAWSAELAAELAARSAAWSAELAAALAARSAALAAWSAELAAALAARSAALAARSAELVWSAKKKLIKSIDTWFINHIKELEIYE